MRRAAFAEVGGYRTAFEPAEDLDLWLRLGERFQLANVSSVGIRYRLHSRGVSASRYAEQRSSSLRAVREAISRRELAGTALCVGMPLDVPSKAETLRRLARLALHARNYGTARHLAFNSVVAAPFSHQAWLTSALAVAGPAGRAVLMLWGKLDTQLRRTSPGPTIPQ
jgi:hypothetical protein